MFRRLFVRVVNLLAARVLSVPCAIWFMSRVLVIVPGSAWFTLTPDDARALSESLRKAADAHTKPQR